MNLSLRNAGLASAFTALMFAVVPTASAQTASNQDTVNQRPSQQDCINPQDCPDLRGRVERRERIERRDRRNRDRAQQNDDDNNRADRRERRRAENNRDRRFDPDQHERRRNRDARFRFYFNGFWYPEPYWTYSYGYGLPVVPGRISCGQGREELRFRGYRRINTIECSGRTYTYTARRDGIRYRVLVNARTGNVIDRDRL